MKLDDGRTVIAHHDAKTPNNSTEHIMCMIEGEKNFQPVKKRRLKSFKKYAEEQEEKIQNTPTKMKPLEKVAPNQQKATDQQILKAYELNDGNKAAAARSLNMATTTYRNRLKKLMN